MEPDIFVTEYRVVERMDHDEKIFQGSQDQEDQQCERDLELRASDSKLSVIDGEVGMLSWFVVTW